MLNAYKEYMETLATDVRRNEPDSARLTEQDNAYILEIFSASALGGMAESLFMTADENGMTVCLENNLCVSPHSLKQFLLKDFNGDAPSVVAATALQVRAYTPGLKHT